MVMTLPRTIPFLSLLAATLLAAALVGNPTFAEVQTHSVVDQPVRFVLRRSELSAAAAQPPGVVIGITSRDWQQSNAMGHQIASNPGSNTVHFVWVMHDHIPYDAEDYWNYYSNYNSWDKTSGTLNNGSNGVSVSTGVFDFNNQGGFICMDVDSDNLCHAVLSQCLDVRLPSSAWHLHFPLEGAALHIDTELPDPVSAPVELGQVWPDIAITQNNGLKDGSGDIRHVIAGGTDFTTPHHLHTDHIWYWRYDAGALTPVWEGPALLDSCKDAAWAIDAADNSGKVAAAFTSDYITDGLNELNNVVYRESRTAGSGWLDGTELGEAHKNFVTSYAVPAGRQSWRETAIAYDHSGVLHIIYIEQLYAYATEKVSLYHWSDAQRESHLAAAGHYPNDGTWMMNLNFSQISLGIGDGVTLCDGGTTTNEDYLYLLYMKLGGDTPEEQADTSRAGLANGEIYLTVSPNGGVNWSDPVNLTDTKSPDCHGDGPDSLCASESWGSLARDVSDIEILYILDYEAGGLYETEFTLNDVMYVNIPGGTIDAALLCPYFSCNCPCLGDPHCDGSTDVLDVVQAVDVAFRNGQVTAGYACPREQTDVNCSSATDALDVVRFVNVAFRNGDPATEFCNPCQP
jgi:hypothetical protein